MNEESNKQQIANICYHYVSDLFAIAHHFNVYNPARDWSGFPDHCKRCASQWVYLNVIDYQPAHVESAEKYAEEIARNLCTTAGYI